MTPSVTMFLFPLKILFNDKLFSWWEFYHYIREINYLSMNHRFKKIKPFYYITFR